MSHHQYGSLGETVPAANRRSGSGSGSGIGAGFNSGGHQLPTAWQAEQNSEVQRVTQKAMIYELIHEQTRTIESVVPWFLENMPPAYVYR